MSLLKLTCSKNKYHLKIFVLFCFHGRVHLELVVKFTIMTSLGFNTLNCKMVKETISICISECHQKHVRVDVEVTLQS